MAPRLDPAIAKALSLDVTTASISTHGGSGFASTFKIESINGDGSKKIFFVKTGKGEESEVMFTGEHASLNTISTIDPTLCPKSHAHGKLSESNGSYLATDFLDLSSTSSSPKGSGIPLATKLANLHSTPAPIPEGYSTPMFGFPVTTCCGSTPQDNTYKSSWADFYANNRLRGILRECKKSQHVDSELEDLVEKTASIVVPRLLADGHLKSARDGGDIRPVVVHGDLWSGNQGKGSISNGGGVEEVVFDASACYAHSEYEFGIMGMFGGFGAPFNKQYHELKGKDEPVEEWDDRVALYEVYHHLNHFAMFGGGYRGGAVSVMMSLTKKYGKDN